MAATIQLWQTPSRLARVSDRGCDPGRIPARPGPGPKPEPRSAVSPSSSTVRRQAPSRPSRSRRTRSHRGNIP